MPAVSFRHDGYQLLVRVAVLTPLDHPRQQIVTASALIDTGAVRSGIAGGISGELELKRSGKIIITTPAGDHVARQLRFRLGFFTEGQSEGALPHVLDDEFLGIESSRGAQFEVLIAMDVLRNAELVIRPDRTGRLAFA